jgi:hypothetical protein
MMVLPLRAETRRYVSMIGQCCQNLLFAVSHDMKVLHCEAEDAPHDRRGEETGEWPKMRCRCPVNR